MSIFERIIQLERSTGKRILLRGIRETNPEFRGRITKRPLYYLLEYRDDEPGYFWHYDIVAELLDCLEQERVNVTLYEDGCQFQEVPLADLLSHRKKDNETL